MITENDKMHITDSIIYKGAINHSRQLHASGLDRGTCFLSSFPLLLSSLSHRLVTSLFPVIHTRKKYTYFSAMTMELVRLILQCVGEGLSSQI